MNGLDKITERIAADARAEAEALLTQGRSQAREVAVQWEEKAAKQSAELLAQGEKAAAERLERLDSMAHMEGRKLLLGARQELIAQAFDKALEQLLALPEEKYVDLLAQLCLKAAVTGKEEIIFSPADQKKVGSKVAAKVNEQRPGWSLTVSEQTRDIKGGVILASQGVEVNCAFEALVRLSRPQLERQVAKILFGE